MNPSRPSWPPATPEWPPYFSPEQPRVDENRGARTVMALWASAVLLAAIIVLVYLLSKLV